jgi:hypothetical protein
MRLFRAISGLFWAVLCYPEVVPFHFKAISKLLRALSSCFRPVRAILSPFRAIRGCLMLLYGSFWLSWFHKGQFVAFRLVLYQSGPRQGRFKAISGCFRAILVCTEVVLFCCEQIQGCLGSFMGCFGMLQGPPKLFLSILGRFEVVPFHFKVKRCQKATSKVFL